VTLKDGFPRPIGDRRAHLMRVRRMAKTLGADPAAARQAGDLSHGDWADIVERCRHCPAPGQCDRWLSRHADADAAMPGCLNAVRLAKLKDGNA
jgi:hypothetical protein